MIVDYSRQGILDCVEASRRALRTTGPGAFVRARVVLANRRNGHRPVFTHRIDIPKRELGCGEAARL